jgi:hypothetical protein
MTAMSADVNPVQRSGNDPDLTPIGGAGNGGTIGPVTPGSAGGMGAGALWSRPGVGGVRGTSGPSGPSGPTSGSFGEKLPSRRSVGGRDLSALCRVQIGVVARITSIEPRTYGNWDRQFAAIWPHVFRNFFPAKEFLMQQSRPNQEAETDQKLVRGGVGTDLPTPPSLLIGGGATSGPCGPSGPSFGSLARKFQAFVQ